MNAHNTMHEDLEKALKHFNSGNLSEAESLLNEIYHKEPDNIDASFYLGILAAHKGNAEKAINHWKQALKVDANHFESLSNLGYLYTQINDLKSAKDYLLKASRLKPQREEVSLQLAQVHDMLGEKSQALSILEPLLQEEPVIPDAYLYLADLKAKEGKLQEAEALLNELTRKAPQVHQSHLYLARLYSLAGRTAEAEKAFKKALELGPQFMETTFEYARFLISNGQGAQGASLLDEMGKTYQHNVQVQVQMAGLYEELGNFEKALEAYTKALDLAPGNEEIKNKRSQIYTRFVPPWHMEMLSDLERNEAYQKAIESVVKENSVVLDIGTGSGILSMMAARAGAKHVYTCESSGLLAEAALDIFKKNGYSEKITLFKKYSTQIPPNDLKEKPNVIVAEIFDSGLLGEHAVFSFRHAIEALGAPGCKTIPQSANVVGRIISLPKQKQIHPIKDISGFDLSPFNKFRVAEAYLSMKLSATEHEFMSDEKDLLHVNFEKPWPTIPGNHSQRVELEFEITRNNNIHGVAFWFKLNLTNDISISSAPERKDNHWGQAIAFFDKELAGKKGDVLGLTLCYNDIKIWFENARIVNE
jgi:Flp pilus assembly protein TadD/predicted RNA methylase